jgi:hypothetical protein
MDKRRIATAVAINVPVNAEPYSRGVLALA